MSLMTYKGRTIERRIAWADYDTDCCAACGRAPYRRGDRDYLYTYRENGPVVCSPKCDEKAAAAPRTEEHMS